MCAAHAMLNGPREDCKVLPPTTAFVIEGFFYRKWTFLQSLQAAMISRDVLSHALKP